MEMEIRMKAVILAGIVRCEMDGTSPAPEDLKAFPGNPFEHRLMLLRAFNESTPEQRRGLCVYLDPNDGWKPHWDDVYFVDSIKHSIWDAAESPDDDGLEIGLAVIEMPGEGKVAIFPLAEAFTAKRNLKEVLLIIFPQDEERIAKDGRQEASL